MSSRVTKIRSVLMAVLFMAMVAVAFVILFMRGLTLPLGLVLFARLAFVGVEGEFNRERLKRLPLMVQMGLGVHFVLATGFTLVGIAQLVGFL